MENEWILGNKNPLREGELCQLSFEEHGIKKCHNDLPEEEKKSLFDIIIVCITGYANPDTIEPNTHFFSFFFGSSYVVSMIRRFLYQYLAHSLEYLEHFVSFFFVSKRKLFWIIEQTFE